MNILFITGHPAQVHNFRLLKKGLEQNGHQVFWMATYKDTSKYLLNYFKINFTPLKKPKKNTISRIFALLHNSSKCLIFLKKHNIDIILSRVSPYASLAGFIMNKHHIALADTESSGIYDKLFTKLVSSFITAKSYNRSLRNDQIRFDANIELFYLHPKRFEPAPKTEIDKLLNIEPEKPYVVMRFVSWDAYHDKGLTGLSDKNKLIAAQEFSKYARVFITSEKKIPPELIPYQINIPPEKMHDVLANAKMFFGESATMASESAVLGTQAIYIDHIGRGYTEEEEKFGLVYNFNNSPNNQLDAIQKGIDLLKDSETKSKTLKLKNIFVSQKIDVTAFFVWYIENYPSSRRVIKKNPGYQYSFR